MKEKIRNDVILYLAFWSVYGPMAVGVWHYEDSSLLKLGIVLLIGLGIILGYLFGRELFRKKAEKTHIALPEPQKAPVACFDNVFKPDFGKVKIDLD